MLTNTSTAEISRVLHDVNDVFTGQAQGRAAAVMNESEQKQLMIDLAIRLQMSLDINWVVKQFMEIIYSYISFDGFSYQADGLGVAVKKKRQTGHKCSYNLKVEKQSLGTLSVFRGKKFSVSELDLFENLLFSLLYPLKNSIQFKKASLSASCDALTGVKNRSTFYGSLEREISLSNRKSQPLSLLVIDIDHFKRINDNYGHSAGDEVLKAIAATLLSCVRDSDLLFRYGGEEFVAILNDSSCEAAIDVAQRLVEKIKAKTISYQDNDISVTVSIGITCLAKDDTSESFFNRADNALYEAKHNGRDQVKVASL
ncbi:MAG: GGDEF domain-containing protein [Gammaproteobacteria bacterium]|nr:GGDEF domain-containing protein [Gammaproteobacteria bacterium]